jgi:hypothetical protein
MPARSAKQQRLFGAALGAKRGAKSFPLAQKLAGQMTEDQLVDFAKTPKAPKMPQAPKMPKMPKAQSYL